MAAADGFGYRLKNELCNSQKTPLSGKKALLYGLMLFSRGFGQAAFLLQTEYECVAALCLSLLLELCGIAARMRVSGGEIPLFSVTTANEREKLVLLGFFSHDAKEVALKVNMANIESEADVACFLRGAFLSCGHVSDPSKAYRLDFVVPRFTLSKNLAYILMDAGFEAKASVRKGSYVLYIKDSGTIEDLITYMGATRATLELMDVKVLKDLRNNINRKTNCETANIEKTVAASAAQIEDIRYLKRTAGFKTLPPELREIAALRLRHSTSSLSELGSMLTPPLSRSGVSHRLKKLSVLADERRKAKGRKKHE